jgi:glycosyltransferase involved in cell wall biosynthesis
VAKRYRVAHRVQIGSIGAYQRASLASVLSAAKLFLLLSDYEAHSIAVLEALSLGIPALVTHTSGLAEFAEEGFVRSVPLNSSAHTIAAAVVDQLRHPVMASNLSLPSWDNCSTNLLCLYYEITNKCPVKIRDVPKTSPLSA